MDKLVQFQFLIENGVDVMSKGEVKKLQRKYGFSEDMYRFLLLLHSQGATQTTTFSSLLNKIENVIAPFNNSVDVWYTMFDLDDSFNLIERNEDTIFSGYFFVFAKTNSGSEFAEVLIGSEKGSIIVIQEHTCEGVDSLEEFFEDYSMYDTDYSLLSEEEVVGSLLAVDQSLFETETTSFNLFLEQQLGYANYN